MHNFDTKRSAIGAPLSIKKLEGRNMISLFTTNGTTMKIACISVTQHHPVSAALVKEMIVLDREEEGTQLSETMRPKSSCKYQPEK
ncbi:hypothetical protein V6N13_007611 [Hibiscus sabdariffa]